MAQRGKQIMVGLALGAWLSTWCLGSAQAGFAARILVVASGNVPAPVRKAATAAIAMQGELCSESDYAREAAEQGVSPRSAEAIERVGTAQHARLIALLGVRNHWLIVRFLDGRNAAPVHDVSVALERRGLSPNSKGQIEEATHLALTILQGQQYITAAPPVVANEPSAAEAMQEPVALPPSAAAADSGAEELPIAEPSDLPEAPAALEPRAALEALDRLSTAVGVGIGIGRRTQRFPSAAGERALAADLFPAVNLSLSAEAPLGEHGLFGAHARYQTSVGLVARETPLADSVSQHTSLRSHHFELGFMPGYRFSRSADSVSLHVFIGWAFRGLRPVVDISVPASTLSGVVLRPELLIPIADGLLSLRIAPELLGVVRVTDALRKAGNTDNSGVGLGAELALELRALDSLHFALCFRESHVSIGTAWMNSLSDDERFVTLQSVLLF